MRSHTKAGVKGPRRADISGSFLPALLPRLFPIKALAKLVRHSPPPRRLGGAHDVCRQINFRALVVCMGQKWQITVSNVGR